MRPIALLAFAWPCTHMQDELPVCRLVGTYLAPLIWLREALQTCQLLPFATRPFAFPGYRLLLGGGPSYSGPVYSGPVYFDLAMPLSCSSQDAELKGLAGPSSSMDATHATTPAQGGTRHLAQVLPERGSARARDGHVHPSNVSWFTVPADGGTRHLAQVLPERGPARARDGHACPPTL